MNEAARQLRVLGSEIVKENDTRRAQVAWNGAKEIERLENELERWRSLAREVFAAVSSNGKSRQHPSIAAKEKEWPKLWSAIDAVVAHVSTLEQDKTND